MGRIRVLAVALALGSIILGPIPAHAGSVWDPDDIGHRFDVRWVGAYKQPDGRIRVTVTFYDSIRTRWFRSLGPVVSIEFTEHKRTKPNLFLGFIKSRSHGRVYAQLCEYGVKCGSRVHVQRPDRRTLRVLFEPLTPYGPKVGWYFIGRSDSSDLRALIDITGWGKITKTRWGVFT